MAREAHELALQMDLGPHYRERFQQPGKATCWAHLQKGLDALLILTHVCRYARGRPVRVAFDDPCPLRRLRA